MQEIPLDSDSVIACHSANKYVILQMNNGDLKILEADHDKSLAFSPEPPILQVSFYILYFIFYILYFIFYILYFIFF